MPGPRDYSESTRAALALLSRGECYYPGCTERIMVFVDDEPYINYQIAHIRDARPGNRYDASMSDDDRRSFKNLILLCKPHHELVDKRHPERFGVEQLEEWKALRERGIAEPLSEVGDLEESDLEALLRESLQMRIDGVNLVDLGGKGGGPLGGGGGGGVIGPGEGGPGGPGGNIVLLDGAPGSAPGGGGGGGGAVDPRIIKRTFRRDGLSYAEIDPDAMTAGPSAAARQDEQLGPALNVVAAMFADAIQLRDGLLYILGGGWEFVRLPAVPGKLGAGFVTIIDGLAGESRTTEVSFAVEDPDGRVRQSETQIVNLADTPEPRRTTLLLTIDVEDVNPGIWRVVLKSGDVGLADLPLRVEGPPTSEGAVS